jgi:hypothetical protein
MLFALMQSAREQDTVMQGKLVYFLEKNQNSSRRFRVCLPAVQR